MNYILLLRPVASGCFWFVGFVGFWLGIEGCALLEGLGGRLQELGFQLRAPGLGFSV